MILTYKYRVKDASSGTRKALRAQARGVNFVWNYCCQIDKEAYRRYRAGSKAKRPSAFDLIKLCTGVSKELGLHSDCISAVCQKFVDGRDACFPKTPKFRSFKRNLDWVPFSIFTRPAKLECGVLTVMKRGYHLWCSRPLPENGKPKAWSFSTDARGRWYVNIAVDVPEAEKRAGAAVGIDLGLKAVATLSNGVVVENPRLYREAEVVLATFQRRGQKVRARAMSAKIANQRKHFLHVASTEIVMGNAEIYVGDVSSRFLQATNGKSSSDAATEMFRSMLQYKSIATGAKCEIVPERMTTQTCSCCGSVTSSTRPKGIAGLGIRSWHCDDCGTLHDRDVNAARNILRTGLEH